MTGVAETRDQDDAAEAALIDRLAADLRPVRRLSTPNRQALLWLALVAAIAAALAAVSRLGAVEHRLMAADDMWLSAVGSVATAILAAIAAFQLSRPDRQHLWALLPLPAVVLWLGASGAGCLRQAPLPGMPEATMHQTMECLRFIVGFSVPLSIVLLLMLRRARPLWPAGVAAMGGLAAAAASASLLWFVHPYDASTLDLAIHAVGVTLVVVVVRLGGLRVLR
jgi:hypothetical protein